MSDGSVGSLVAPKNGGGISHRIHGTGIFTDP